MRSLTRRNSSIFIHAAGPVPVTMTGEAEELLYQREAYLPSRAPGQRKEGSESGNDSGPAVFPSVRQARLTA
jgi:hypothetical protein